MAEDDELDDVERAEQEVEQIQEELRNYKRRVFIGAVTLGLIALVAVIAVLSLDGVVRIILICGAALFAVAYAFDLNRQRSAVERCSREYEQAKSRLDHMRRKDA